MRLLIAILLPLILIMGCSNDDMLKTAVEFNEVVTPVLDNVKILEKTDKDVKKYLDTFLALREPVNAADDDDFFKIACRKYPDHLAENIATLRAYSFKLKSIAKAPDDNYSDLFDSIKRHQGSADSNDVDMSKLEKNSCESRVKALLAMEQPLTNKISMITSTEDLKKIEKSIKKILVLVEKHYRSEQVKEFISSQHPELLKNINALEISIESAQLEIESVSLKLAYYSNKDVNPASDVLGSASISSLSNSLRFVAIYEQFDHLDVASQFQALKKAYLVLDDLAKTDGKITTKSVLDTYKKLKEIHDVLKDFQDAYDNIEKQTEGAGVK